MVKADGYGLGVAPVRQDACWRKGATRSSWPGSKRASRCARSRRRPASSCWTVHARGVCPALRRAQPHAGPEFAGRSTSGAPAARGAHDARCRDPSRHRHKPPRTAGRTNCRVLAAENECGGSAESTSSLIMSHLACADDPASTDERGAASTIPRRARHAVRRRRRACRRPAGVLLGKDYRLRSGASGHRALWRQPAGGRGANPFSRCGATDRPRSSRSVALTRGRALVTEPPSGSSGRRRSPPWLWDMRTVSCARIGNRGAGAIGGARAPVVGRVSMDLDDARCDRCSAALADAGAEVEFFGDTISLEEIAAAAGTADLRNSHVARPRACRRLYSRARHEHLRRHRPRRFWRFLPQIGAADAVHARPPSSIACARRSIGR